MPPGVKIWVDDGVMVVGINGKVSVDDGVMLSEVSMMDLGIVYDSACCCSTLPA